MFDTKTHYKPLYDYLEEHPSAYFGVLAGGRLWVFSPDKEEFTASDNSQSVLEPDSPLLRTEIIDGVEVMPLLKFDNIDELLDFMQTRDIQEEYINACHYLAAAFAQQMEAQNSQYLQNFN